jgi:fumarate hydratase subunit alpha
MRTIAAADVIEAVATMAMESNVELPADVWAKFRECAAREEAGRGQGDFPAAFGECRSGQETRLPLCQDTGLAVLFVEMGEDCRVEGGLRAAIDEGVRKGYKDGYLRKSACDPFTRKNTGDNTPAIIHIDLVPGDRLKIAFMAKGGGSENMSRVTFLSPAQGWPGIKDFVVRRVAEAGPNPCPPTVIGVGIGGNAELSAIIAKKALLRELDDVHPDPDIAAKERELLDAINELGIGPMGLGGKTTSLGVKIAVAPCHLASLPLAVNVQCHSSRHREVIL